MGIRTIVTNSSHHGLTLVGEGGTLGIGGTGICIDQEAVGSAGPTRKYEIGLKEAEVIVTYTVDVCGARIELGRECT